MQDAYAEPDNDTRNLVGFKLAVAVQDIQDMPPIFTDVPPVTVLNNTLQKVSPVLLDSQLPRCCFRKSRVVYGNYLCMPSFKLFLTFTFLFVFE
jgi:hypothetical protein